MFYIIKDLSDFLSIENAMKLQLIIHIESQQLIIPIHCLKKLAIVTTTNSWLRLLDETKSDWTCRTDIWDTAMLSQGPSPANLYSFIAREVAPN